MRAGKQNRAPPGVTSPKSPLDATGQSPSSTACHREARPVGRGDPARFQMDVMLSLRRAAMSSFVLIRGSAELS